MKAEQLLHRLGSAADASGAMGLEFGRLAKFEEAEVAVRVCIRWCSETSDAPSCCRGRAAVFLVSHRKESVVSTAI